MVIPNPNAVKAQQANLFYVSKNAANKSARPQSLYLPNSDADYSKFGKMKNVSFKWLEDKLPRKSFTTPGDDGDEKVCCKSSLLAEQLKYKIDFCAHYMSKNLETIQSYVNQLNKTSDKSDSQNEDIENVLISIAELKKIRDILDGTIAFENSLR